jgi:hypothetical protein
MLRTNELLLGLPPMSQYAAATPMYASFTDKPDLEPYRHTAPKLDAIKRELDVLAASTVARSLYINEFITMTRS